MRKTVTSEELLALHWLWGRTSENLKSHMKSAETNIAQKEACKLAASQIDRCMDHVITILMTDEKPWANGTVHYIFKED